MTNLMPITGVIRDYAWGSRTALTELLDVPSTGESMAELWLGAHPDDPARRTSDDLPLDRVIAADPLALLGDRSQQRFGSQLPYLLKVLAIDKALSIQVHPSRQQAENGFAAQGHVGGPSRNYQDANHKPELICALTELTAFCGFRPPVATFAYLADLQAHADVPELAEVAALLRGPDGLRAAFIFLLREGSADLSARIAAGCVELAQSSSQWAHAAAAAALGADDFPGDVGVGASLLLNVVTLMPGEALFLGAGNVHAYLRGVGVEIMANSDNVLRCGFTPKHVDVAELLAVADFTPLDDPMLRPVQRDGVSCFNVPVPDFRLLRQPRSGVVSLPAGLPRILLCTSGQVTGRDGNDEITLTRGEAAFVSAAARVELDCAGDVFVAEPGL